MLEYASMCDGCNYNNVPWPSLVAFLHSSVHTISAMCICVIVTCDADVQRGTNTKPSQHNSTQYSDRIRVYIINDYFDVKMKNNT